MHTKLNAIPFAIFFVTLLTSAAKVAAEDWEAHGRVVDENGKPVAGASVADFWSGNGKRLRADGSFVRPAKTDDDKKLAWGHVGEMEPFLREDSSTTDADGQFTLKLTGGEHKVLAMDADRKHAGIVTVARGKESEPIEVRLGPLVRVRGDMKCAVSGLAPQWCIADVSLPDDSERPLDSSRLLVCGTLDGHFELSLPPGKYFLNAYGNATEAEDSRVHVMPVTEMNLTAERSVVDLGTLRPVAYLLPHQRVEKAKANGTRYDYQKHYGEPPPPWHVTDAHGVSKEATIANFKGKWVLLTFWGMSCTVCLGDELPKLMKFYDEHQAQRDQFEIVAICIDYDGDLKTMADVDRALNPIVKNVWGGKTLPFPVMLDPSFKTWETYGIDGLGTTILIDPDGKMMEGNEKTLAEKLK
jgi:cytochrome oxidase Cu insertion factor (SCO1/SenC/PrrC family)